MTSPFGIGRDVLKRPDGGYSKSELHLSFRCTRYICWEKIFRFQICTESLRVSEQNLRMFHRDDTIRAPFVFRGPPRVNASSMNAEVIGHFCRATTTFDDSACWFHKTSK